MIGREQPTLERQQLLEAVEEIIAGRIVLSPPQRVGGRRVGAGRAAEAGRSMRPGNSPSSTLKRSATWSAAWFGDHHLLEPTCICVVAAAIWPIMISGAELAMFGMLWCSATQ